VMANEVGPARGKPTTKMAHEAVSTIGSPVRGFHHGPEPNGAPEKRPQIRLQSVLLAQRPRSSVVATQNNGAL
jgi:hypothetical protein